MASIKQKILNILSGGRRQHAPDVVLIITVAIIIIFGVVMLSSATSAFSYVKYKDSYYFFKNQIFGILIGLVGFYFFSQLDYHIWKKYAFGMMVFSVFLLVLVFIPGLRAGWGTSRSWINVFGYSLQPSEFVKITFLMYLAAWMETRGKKLKDFHHGTLPFLIVLGIISILMLLQPDFGTLSIIALTSMIVYYISGANIKHIVVIFLISVLGLFVMLKIKPYQADRFRCFYEVGYSANKACYQVNQALIAVGSGGFWGRGLGGSRQKFMYLPEVSGDAIFPIIGEETGFIFGSGLVILFGILFYRGYLICLSAPDKYGKILALGLSSWLTLQAIINIGGMLKVMPMTGVPLPFVSYGGSAILAALCAVGLLVNISKQTK